MQQKNPYIIKQLHFKKQDDEYVICEYQPLTNTPIKWSSLYWILRELYPKDTKSIFDIFLKLDTRTRHKWKDVIFLENKQIAIKFIELYESVCVSHRLTLYEEG